MSEQAWKRLERRVAEKLGGTRTGPQGRHGSDVKGIPYAVEVKRTTRYSLRKEWLEQARRQSRQERKPWMLVIAEHGAEPIAVVDFDWLVDILAENEARRLTILHAWPVDATGGAS
jgi:hypothetical protein